MKRIPQLDGVRGVAVLMVIVWHYFVCRVDAAPGSVAYYARHALSLTWSGVDLFFVLSGFLIAGILLDQRRAPNYFRVFYLRRTCRIFPLYFLILGLFVCLAATPLFTSPSYQWLFHDPLPPWTYATFTQNFFMGVHGGFGAHWLGATWSLAVEEQFYLVVPLLIYFLPRRALVCVLVLAILAAPVLRWASPGFHAFVNTPWRSDSLLSGALLAVLVRWRPFLAFVPRHPVLLLALFGTLLVGAGAMTWREGLLGPLDHFWLAGLYSAFVLIAFTGSSPHLGRMLASPALVWLGQLSYGIYMFHQPVNGLVHGALRHSAPQIRSLSEAGITLVSFFVTLALAMLSYRFLERPFLKFGHRFTYQAGPAREALPQGARTDA